MKKAHIYRSSEGERAIKCRYDEILADWPVANEKQTIETDYGRTFVVSCGRADAPPLLLLHGSGSNSFMWLADSPVYAVSHRVHAVDLMGEPGRSDPLRLPLEDGVHGEWLWQVLRGLGHDRASVVGMSLGGWVALDFATRFPQAVDTLVLLCPGGLGRERRSFLLRAILYLALGRAGRERMLNWVTNGKALDGDVVDYMMLVFDHFLPRRGELPKFTDAQLRRLTMPVQLIVGAVDRLLDSEETVARLESNCPDLAVEWIEGEGHMLTDFGGTIAAFVSARTG